MEPLARRALRVATTLRSFATYRNAAPAAWSSRIIARHPSRRAFASETTASTANKAWPWYSVLGTLCLIGGGVGLHTIDVANKRPTVAESPESVATGKAESDTHSTTAFTPVQKDYQQVYDAIASRLVEEDDYDDGSYAPILLRLGWHSSGSYDAATNTGGSNGATMRFPPEGSLPANSGLLHARTFLDPIKAQFPWISYSDLWILGAVCAVQEMGGPTIPFRPGRSDKSVAFCSPDGRLPDAKQGPAHLRAIFGRMGFDDREIVALSGGHAVGRCHVNRTGFDGPWTFSPTMFTNAFFQLLVDEEWGEREWEGNRQFQDRGSKSLMMLPTDFCLVEDEVFRGWVETYAADEDVFFGDFQRVLVKLFELGVPFEEGEERMVLQRSE